MSKDSATTVWENTSQTLTAAPGESVRVGPAQAMLAAIPMDGSAGPFYETISKGWYDDYMSTWKAFCREVGPKWLDLGGWPNWAKEWQVLDIPGVDIYEKLPKMYGCNPPDFKKARDALDPTETFLFPWTGKIFASA